MTMTLYAPGAESAARVDVLIKMAGITSEPLINAIKDHLVHAWPIAIAALRHDYDKSNLQRGLSKINDQISYHNQLMELR